MVLGKVSSVAGRGGLEVKKTEAMLWLGELQWMAGGGLGSSSCVGACGHGGDRGGLLGVWSGLGVEN